ncbi:Putative Flp pilus-assembly TadE/G-like [Bryocella elongata]|uniref:Putative Flp pilus-assembly TadE/G-like n=1 Tax=Bryocella elongata TaxID=863522 RepID=A0A1H5Y1D2_9BACT|nr:pilus assembly protein TadG-related protein [Bryocella elongata]SEG17575.1 Putative Flp pilus-assembly TadE/G-like [Bryocella elongata]
MTVRNGERGQATIMMAIFMGLVMMGFLGFALDVGYFFQQKRQAQVAADAAAVAAAEEYSSNNSSNAQSAANAIAALNGFSTTATTNPATVTITQPASGDYSSASTGTPSWVQATVSKPVPTFFLAAFNGQGTMNILASAMAGYNETSPTCICLEGGTGQDLNMSNNSKLTATGCGVTVNSSSNNAVGIVGSATLSALSLGTISTTWDNSNNVNNNGKISSSTSVVLGISSGCSPALPAAPTYGTCSADPLSSVQNGGSTYTVGPGSSYGTTTSGGTTVCYNALTVGANGDTVTLNPGVYVINGGSLHFESGTQKGGSGVFFYLVNGATLTIDNGANPTLSAPTSGTYQNALIYQPSSNTSTVNFQGGSTTNISGIVYAPGANVTVGNGSSSTLNLGIVAQSLTLNGGCNLTSTNAPNQGTNNSSAATLR